MLVGRLTIRSKQVDCQQRLGCIRATLSISVNIFVFVRIANRRLSHGQRPLLHGHGQRDAVGSAVPEVGRADAAHPLPAAERVSAGAECGELLSQCGRRGAVSVVLHDERLGALAVVRRAALS